MGWVRPSLQMFLLLRDGSRPNTRGPCHAVLNAFGRGALPTEKSVGNARGGGEGLLANWAFAGCLIILVPNFRQAAWDGAVRPSRLELPEGGLTGAAEVLPAGELAHGVDEALLVAGVEEACELHVLGKEGVCHLAAGV